jgi:phenylpropionate dioxygenase-like ring-hydroxylating dioxygenase large terminal subunit
MNMSQGQVEATAHAQTDSDHGLAQLLESQQLERTPFPIPSGWFFVDYAENLSAGQVRNIHLFDQEWVLFRGESGKVGMTDPYCPHLGAHLGHGGKVCGDHLRCPFHHWEYNTEGFCTKVPYAKVAPSVIKKRPILRALPMQERYGMIWAWFHPYMEPPSWDLPRLPCMEDEGWVGDLRGTWTANTAIQEIAENGVDVAHLKFLHGAPIVPPIDVEYEKHTMRFNIGGGYVVGEMWGPSAVGTVTFTQEGVSATMFSYTQPVSRERSQMNMSFRHKDYPAGSKELHIAKKLIDHMMHEAEGETSAGFESVDMIIWNNKKYRRNPLLCDGDGPILTFRKWFRQYYAAGPEVMAKI